MATEKDLPIFRRSDPFAFRHTRPVTAIKGILFAETERLWKGTL